MTDEQTKKEQIISKLRKLTMFTTEHGCTEGEAASAASKLSELLEAYGLSEHEVNTTVLVSDIGVCEAKTEYSSSPTWLWVLASEIGAAFDCRILMGKYFDPTRQYGTSTKINFRFIGEKVEVELVSWFFETLYSKLYKLADSEIEQRDLRGAHKTAFRNSFIIAASHVISKRLADERRASSAANPTLAALVLSKKTAIVAYMAEKHSASKTRDCSYTSSSWGGHIAGQTAGASISLTKGVGGSSKSRAQLT